MYQWRWLAIPPAVGVACGMAAGAAFAQAAPEETVQERLQQIQPAPAAEVSPEELILTGREDLVLLRERTLFALSAQAGYQFTTNAFLTDDDTDDDHVLNGAVALRAATQIAQRVDVFAEVGVFGSRYADNPELDFDALLGSLGAGLPVGNWRFGLAYSPSFAYERGLDDHLVTLHDLSLTTSRPFSLRDDLAVLPAFTLSRAFADPHDFTTTSARAAITVVYQIAPDLLLSAGPQAYVRQYDDFFEERTDETRRDIGITVGAGLRWAPVEAVAVSASVRFTGNESTVGAHDYTVLDAGPVLQATIRF